VARGKTEIFLFAVVRYRDVFGTLQEIVQASGLHCHVVPDEFEAGGGDWQEILSQGALHAPTVPNFGHST
jgi:hypothetical protein